MARVDMAGLRDILITGRATASDQSQAIWDLGGGPWWKLFTAHRALEATKLALLEAAWQLPETLFLRPPENPADTELARMLVAHGPETWAVDRKRSPREFYGVELSHGNWFLYAAREPWMGRVPNTFRTAPPDLRAFMLEAGMTFFVDAFYDDIEWRVGVAP